MLYRVKIEHDDTSQAGRKAAEEGIVNLFVLSIIGMKPLKSRILAVTGLITVLSNLQGAAAWAADWQVSKVSGQAWTGAEGQDTEIATGMVVAAGVSIHTGPRGRVMLQRGTESMVIGPKSVVAVSDQPGAGLSTTVLEKAGTVSFDVEKQNVQHFSVETPMLAAVVKGTHFTVAVGRADGQVAVTRGTVQVTSLKTGQQTNVTAGQHASVGSRGLSVSGIGQRAPVTRVAPRAPVVGLAPAATAVGTTTPGTEASPAAAPAAAAASTSAAHGGSRNGIGYGLSAPSASTPPAAPATTTVAPAAPTPPAPPAAAPPAPAAPQQPSSPNRPSPVPTGPSAAALPRPRPLHRRPSRPRLRPRPRRRRSLPQRLRRRHPHNRAALRATCRSWRPRHLLRADAGARACADTGTRSCADTGARSCADTGTRSCAATGSRSCTGARSCIRSAPARATKGTTTTTITGTTTTGTTTVTREMRPRCRAGRSPAWRRPARAATMQPAAARMRPAAVILAEPAIWAALDRDQ